MHLRASFEEFGWGGTPKLKVAAGAVPFSARPKRASVILWPAGFEPTRLIGKPLVITLLDCCEVCLWHVLMPGGKESE